MSIREEDAPFAVQQRLKRTLRSLPRSAKVYASKEVRICFPTNIHPLCCCYPALRVLRLAVVVRKTVAGSSMNDTR